MVSDGALPPTRRVTLDTLPEYAREVLNAATAGMEAFPEKSDIRLPGLDVTAYSDRGALSETIAFGLSASAWAERVPGEHTKMRVFMSHPGLGAIVEAPVWGERMWDPYKFTARLEDVGLRGDYYHDMRYWQLYDLESRVGVQLMLSADGYPPWEPGAPLRSFLHWEYAARGMRLVHGGTLGINGRGVILAGSGGAGKSGTVVAGILGGLDSVGDDYVLVGLDSGVAAYPLFTTLKQDHPGWQRLGLDRKLERPSTLNWQGKYQFRIDDIVTRSVPSRLNIGALLVPHVTREARTTTVPMARKDAMIALTTSGLGQLAGDRESGFRFFSELTRMVPCYKLRLGVEPEEIAGAMAEFIEQNV